MKQQQVIASLNQVIDDDEYWRVQESPLLNQTQKEAQVKYFNLTLADGETYA